ncbi:MAG: hypothetical protein ACJAWV_000864 [Flammeovirgaceae bacterium]|jgi:hypothetical protein
MVPKLGLFCLLPTMSEITDGVTPILEAKAVAVMPISLISSRMRWFIELLSMMLTFKVQLTYAN